MPTLAQLDARHMREQRINASEIARLILGYWAVVDPLQLASTIDRWLSDSVQAVLEGHQRSYQIAAAYALGVREIQTPRAPSFVPPPLTPPSEEQIRRSLVITGPGTLRKKLNRIPDAVEPEFGAPPKEIETFQRVSKLREARVEEARVEAGAAAGRSAFKMTTDGARDGADLIIASDRTALGYMRVTREKPCGWCLMLASRGPVYKEDSFASSDPRFTGPGNHKVHDGCGCTLRPAYNRDISNWTDTARTADTLWVEMSEKTGKSGNALINEFRNEAKRRGLADLSRW